MMLPKCRPFAGVGWLGQLRVFVAIASHPCLRSFADCPFERYYCLLSRPLF